jgi:hypothetical protein
MLGLGRQEHGRLTGRIAAADQDDLFVLAQLALDRRSPVVHAFAFELAQIGQRRTAVARAAGQHHGACLQALQAAAHFHLQRVGVAQQPSGRRGMATSTPNFCACT